MDRNYSANAVDQILPGSLSARRAWIEITVVGVLATLVTAVALRKESVDRNFDTVQVIVIVMESLSARRAWIEIKYVVKDSDFSGSLSARRAWIEIANFCRNRFCPTVALRKESVDRNRTPHQRNTKPIPSLSARRAWIEMPRVGFC